VSKAYLSLGSNIEPERHLRAAIVALRARFGDGRFLVDGSLILVSMIVIGKHIHSRIGAGRVALTIRPGGMMTLRLRKAPSLIG